MSKVKPETDAYRKLFPQCQYPGCLRTATELHHIASGPSREAALSVRETWLHLCTDCHEELQGAGIEINCAVKLLADPYYFDLDVVSSVRGRAKGALTLSGVAAYLDLAVDRS